MNKIIGFIATIIGLYAFRADAQDFVKTSQKLSVYKVAEPKLRKQLEEQASNIFDGMDWVNHRLVQERQYCLPHNFILNGPTILAIVERETRALPSLGEQPIGLAILISLTQAFPCH